MSFTSKLLILSAMIFCHIMDDYYLQGILSKMKQRDWWKKNAPSSMYQKDYVMALFEHAFSWSFVMSLPLLLATVIFRIEYGGQWLIVGYVVNTICHAYVDNLKANRKKINLIQDQSIHLCQIFMLWFCALF